MSELIYKQDAIDALGEEPLVWTDSDEELADYNRWEKDVEAIKNLPSAEPKRKKGKWEWCGNHRLCSECDEWALTVWDDNEYEEVDVLTNFCPNCGADMRGDLE